MSEIDSSTILYKVSPVGFENSEDNVGLINTMLRYLSERLPMSRWQRSLTDSTVLCNIDVAFGCSLPACDACLHGLGRLETNLACLVKDLDAC